MTNPNNAVGTNGAFNGRTSVNAFNDIMAAYSKGIVSGWACAPSTGMTVTLGGSGSVRDVAIAEDNAGNKTSINNISGSPITVTIPAAPSTNNRIDLIVGYADNPPTGDGTSTDNPGTVGLIVVSGTAAGTPSAPNDTAIRTAITADGATGASAYYVILAQIYVGTSVTTIGSGAITAGDAAQNITPLGAGTVTSTALASGAVTSGKIGSGAVTSAKLDNSNLFKSATALTANKSIPASTKTTIQSFSLPAGTWRIFWGIRLFGDHSANDIVYGGLTVNAADVQTDAANGLLVGGTIRSTITSVYDATLTGTTTVSTVATIPMAGQASKDNCYLKAIRIG